jgi:hypothetical protein
MDNSFSRGYVKQEIFNWKSNALKDFPWEIGDRLTKKSVVVKSRKSGVRRNGLGI